MSTTVTGQPAPTTRRMTMTVAGLVLSRWTSCSVSRNLRDIAGSFTLQYRDSGREAQSFSPDLDPFPRYPKLLCGQACLIAIDGTPVLKGWIDEVDADWEGGQLSCTLTGRDVTGDLVDCAAAPNASILKEKVNGKTQPHPVEWRNLSVLQIAQQIAAPFSIPVMTDVDIGGTFPLFGIDADETALSAIAKACRQGAILPISNGIGGLLLTRGGNSRAPAPLTRPGNIQGGGYKASWAQRFADYYVKGQTNRSVIRSVQVPLFTDVYDPRSGLTIPIESSTQETTTESVTVMMTGHATDPEVTRYRPTVRQVKTQAGSATVQEQADWSLRIAKGMAETLNYTVLDWRAGKANALWLPNSLSKVRDPYADINKDMLISGVTYKYDQAGEVTMLELAGRTAFDRIDEPADDPRYIQTRRQKSFGPTRNG